MRIIDKPTILNNREFGSKERHTVESVFKFHRDRCTEPGGDGSCFLYTKV